MKQVAEQRKQYKLYQIGKPTSITEERINLLESLNFAWKAQEVAWEKHKAQLEKYYQEYGHCSVPLDHPHYPALGNWLKQQRRLYKRVKEGQPHNQLPPSRVLALENLGFDWRSSKRVLELAASGNKTKKEGKNKL